MTKATKTELVTILNATYGAYASFRFSNASDNMKVAGMFNTETKEVIMKSTSAHTTLAHEIAHAIQYNKEGDTCCMTLPLCTGFNKLQNKTEEEIKNNGVAIAWNTRTGWSTKKDWK